MKLFAIRTQRFGTILVEVEGREEAREFARRFDVRAKGDVWPVLRYRLCERCESRPCCCPRKGAA